jgi:hypothetical protein
MRITNVFRHLRVRKGDVRQNRAGAKPNHANDWRRGFVSSERFSMQQLKPEQHEHRQSLIFEYVRLSDVATDSLSVNNPRARPNWFRFYDAHEQMTKLIEKIRQINQH